MTEARKVIARPRDGTGGLRDSARRTPRLPDELLTEHVQRIALFSGVIGGLWGLGLFIDLVLAPLTWGAAVSARAVSLEITGIAAALLMVWYVRYCGHSPEIKTDVSLGYLILNGVGVAVLNTWVVPPPHVPAIHLSWVTIGILVYSMIAPASPRKMLAAALVTASMDPLALWVAHLAGNPVASLPHAVLLALPNYACALVAMLPSRVLHRIGGRLREAQEMGSYLLTGQLVFEAETPMKMLLQHLHARPVPPSQRTELPVPRELDDLVLACLEKDPDRRPQDAEQLFRMACGCRSCEGWNQDLAARWWQVHVPELTGPLTLGMPPAERMVPLAAI